MGRLSRSLFHFIPFYSIPFTYAYAHAHTRTCAHAHMCTCARVHMRTSAHTHTHIRTMHKCTNAQRTYAYAFRDIKRQRLLVCKMVICVKTMPYIRICDQTRVHIAHARQSDQKHIRTMHKSTTHIRTHFPRHKTAAFVCVHMRTSAHTHTLYAQCTNAQTLNAHTHTLSAT